MNKSTVESLYDELEPFMGRDALLAVVNKLDSLMTELADLTLAGNKWAKAHHYPEVEEYPQYTRAREIGHELFQIGGFRLMQAAVGLVRQRFSGKRSANSSLILMEYGWNGIGGWQV